MTNFHNTLFVTTEGAYVGREGESLRVRVEHETRLQVPLHHLASVVCFGRVSVSPEAMGMCAEAGVTIAFLDHAGRFLARVEGAQQSAAQVRRAQYRAADDPKQRVALARAFVAGKIANSRNAVRRTIRSRAGDNDALERASERLARLAENAAKVEDPEELLGIEGEAAARYFERFDEMLSSDSLRFEKRTRRPPLNEVNALLSFGYALLAGDCSAAVAGAGLDPCIGFLHTERAGRPALALDLMEEFRSVVVDRMVIAMVRLKQISASDFERQETGAFHLKPHARKAFLVEYQKRKDDAITHPLMAEPSTWGLMPHLQARLLARAIRGSGDYVPFLAR